MDGAGRARQQQQAEVGSTVANTAAGPAACHGDDAAPARVLNTELLPAEHRRHVTGDNSPCSCNFLSKHTHQQHIRVGARARFPPLSPRGSLGGWVLRSASLSWPASSRRSPQAKGTLSAAVRSLVIITVLRSLRLAVTRQRVKRRQRATNAVTCVWAVALSD